MTSRSTQSLSGRAAKLTFRMIDGVAIRFIESEQRIADALLLSPWPESVFAYERAWSRLAEQAHLVAIDLPGFGWSEYKPSLMTPRAMGDFIAHAADAFHLETPHVVAPDVGTAAALFAAATHPGRCRSLVVGTGGTAVPIQWEDVAEQYAALVSGWWAEGFAACTERATLSRL